MYNSLVEVYNQPRNPSDIDLIHEVRELLLENIPLEKVLKCYDSHHLIKSAVNKIPDVQRHNLNRYWNLQLLTSQADTIHQRFCLVPNGTCEEWLDLFKSSILPFIIKNDLPVMLPEV